MLDLDSFSIFFISLSVFQFNYQCSMRSLIIFSRHHTVTSSSSGDACIFYSIPFTPLGSGHSGVHLVRLLPDSRGGGVQGQDLPSLIRLAVWLGLAKPNEHSRVRPGVVRVQGCVPEPLAQLPQEWNLVSSWRSW